MNYYNILLLYSMSEVEAPAPKVRRRSYPCPCRICNGKEREISCFILFGPFHNKYRLFVDGQYYAAKTSRAAAGGIEHDSWTGKEMMISKTFQRLCTQPTTLLHRKVILYPQPTNKAKPSHFLVIDPDSIDYSEISIPHNHSLYH